MSMDSYVTLIGIGIQTLLFVIGGYAMVIRNDEKQKIHTQELKDDMGDMREELKKLSEVITIQAVQTTRIDNITSIVASLERRVEDLRRGNGYIIQSGEDRR